jgi:hypothetical protein
MIAADPQRKRLATLHGHWGVPETGVTIRAYIVAVCRKQLEIWRKQRQIYGQLHCQQLTIAFAYR